MRLSLRFIPLVLVTLLLCTTACTKKPAEVRQTDAKEALGAQVNKFAIIVDVREKEEIDKTGMAYGSYWLPTSEANEDSKVWQEFKESVLAENKDKEVIVYCAAGARAKKVADFLVSQGYRAANMGAFADWKKEEFAVQVEPLNSYSNSK